MASGKNYPRILDRPHRGFDAFTRQRHRLFAKNRLTGCGGFHDLIRVLSMGGRQNQPIYMRIRENLVQIVAKLDILR